ncbi:DUF4282 domain-containing protein [Nocardiopsis ansamitocini]|uniref:DUF4282 domain-containing protein n=1 Tax=Nocardiopsis ansamitocini TaxID=1670832 RepID=A0A9W6P6M0_9ACTN|nr:DUF4282 domain-containing protein [Nocardiopsis ansamitocini]GLU48101.1 hypothetical protein Nans01_24520 [Nocardiopsis ansamitocini]
MSYPPDPNQQPWQQPSGPYPGQPPQGPPPGSYGVPPGIGYQGAPPPGGPQPVLEKGFFGALFDFGFTTYVTSKVIKVLYVIGLVLVTIATLSFVVSSFSMMGRGGFDTFFGILMLLFSPVLALLYLILLRIWMELLIVVFQIADDLRAIRIRGGF